MAFNDSAFRVVNVGDCTYFRPCLDSAKRAACECIRCGDRNTSGYIEKANINGWEVVARFSYGHGIQLVM